MPAAKLPVADFRTQSDWHAYLGKLTPAQLKKVAAALNKILRTEFRLNTKKPAAELIEDVKKLYSVNNNSKLLEIVKGISADELPQPSQNLPKPSKKQVAAGKEADKTRIRKVIEERVSKAKEKPPMAIIYLVRQLIDGIENVPINSMGDLVVYLKKRHQFMIELDKLYEDLGKIKTSKKSKTYQKEEQKIRDFEKKHKKYYVSYTDHNSEKIIQQIISYIDKDLH